MAGTAQAARAATVTPVIGWRMYGEILQAARAARSMNCPSSPPSVKTIMDMVLTYLIHALIVTSNDIEVNPGPNTLHPDACTCCRQNVNWESMALQCDACDRWVHKECIKMDSIVFNQLEGNTSIWLCNTCGMRNIHSSMSSLSLNNSLGEASNNQTLNYDPGNSPGLPMHASSPIRSNISAHLHTAGQLRILNVNCQSICAKKHEFAYLIESTKPDIIIGTESWLNDDMSNKSVFPTENYNVIRRDRGSRGGGIFILTLNSLIVTREESLETECEITWAKIQLKHKKYLYVGAYYRPSEIDEISLDHLETSINKLRNTNSYIVLGGDLNTPGWNWNMNRPKPNCRHLQMYEKLRNIIDDAGLQQMVTMPTRGPNTLDLILTNCPGRINNLDTIPGISDHQIVTCQLNTFPLRRLQKPRWIAQYGKADWESMAEELCNLQDEIRTYHADDSTEELWKLFKNKLLHLVDKFIPRKRATRIQKLPYITREIEKLINRRNRKYRKLKRMQQHFEHSQPNYIQLECTIKKIKQEIQIKMRRAYWSYLDGILAPETTDGDNQYQSMKRFWKYIKNNQKDHHGVAALKAEGKTSSTAKDKANTLNKQFQSVFSPVQKLPEGIFSDSPHPTSDDITITTPGIFKMLKRLKPHKAAGPDNITARIMKELAQSIAPILQMIFQRSYNTGQIPMEWKEANVVPAYKKGPKTDPANYRPISLTCITCKLMEHIIASNIMKHARQNNIIYDLQHGFLDKRSCETQLLEFQCDILANLEGNHQTDVLIMDFSKAFDKVSHKHLIGKLEYYGMRGRTNRWIEAFLTDRQQCVVLEGESSDKVPVTSGVPQGSVLGPCLFLYYINNMATNIKSTVRLFADDTIAYLTIKGLQDAEQLQEDLNMLGEWEQKWLMEFHPQKCEVLSISKSRNVTYHPYKLHGHELKHTSQAKYLGITMTSDFRWNTHIHNITAKASRNLGFLKRNLQSSSSSIKERAYKALVRPLLEYAPTIWDPSTASNEKKIEMVQRRAARYVTNNYNKTSSVTEMLQSLKWPTLKARRMVMRLCMLYKATNNKVELPSHRTKLRLLNRPSSRHCNGKAYEIPLTAKGYIRDSFYPRTIRDWNILPEDIVNADNYNIFKNRLTKHHCT